MTWFCFPGGWGCYNLNGFAEKELAATGAHGYATQQQAQAHLNAIPNGAQAFLLQKDKAESLSPVGAGAVGVQSTPSGTGGVGGAASNVASSVASGVSSGVLGGSGAALHWPGADSFLGRALKIVVGGVLLLAGIIKMTGAGRALGPVTAAATKLPGV